MTEEKIYEGRILSLSVHEINVNGRQVKREIITHPGAAAILAFDENDDVILVRQDRFPQGYVLEIPAGTLEKGELPMECAFRELEEETGYKAQAMTHLITFYPSIGYNTEAIHCFVASGLQKIAGLKLDDDEVLVATKTNFKDLLTMIKSGAIQDSKTICTVLTYAAREKKMY